MNVSNRVACQCRALSGDTMLKTIMMGSYISVQGLFVKAFPDGRIAVRVGDKVFAGRPV